ncbi:MAG TPA: DUF805 domain-containing protein [Actinopolymorphaceae bacterium]|nr:DUF805 domain-containing protein [Actinopolymorphaceae bacterium]
MQWYLGVLKQYANFHGRARRTEFWMYALFNALIAAVLLILNAVVSKGSVSGPFYLLLVLYNLAVLLPSLAVGVRRLHDTNRSGFWILIGLIPLVGAIILIVFYASPGTQGPNSHGADPKAVQPGGAYNPGAAPA